MDKDKVLATATQILSALLVEYRLNMSFEENIDFSVHLAKELIRKVEETHE